MITHNKHDIVVLKVFNDALEASFVQNRIKEEGIESFLVDENVVGLNPLGGIELKIFSTTWKKQRKYFLK